MNALIKALVLILATAPVLQSQTELRSPNKEVETFRGFASAYGALLVMAFDSIPASRYSFRPTPAQQTIGHIAQHIESANTQLCAHFAGLPRPATSQEQLADSIRARQPKDTLIARLKRSLAFCDTAFARVSDASLAEEMPRLGQSAGQTAPRIRFLILYVTDLVDHYSQIANYMRLNDLVPPSALPRTSR